MTKVSFYCASIGIAVFLIATLIIWQPQQKLAFTPHAVDETTRGVFFSLAKSPTAIFAAGEHGRILFSKDNGQTWQRSKTHIDQSVTGISFQNEHIGWAVGHDGIILSTADAGMTWKVIKKPDFNEPPLFDVRFYDKDFGLAVGADSKVYRSIDSGNTRILHTLDYQTHLYGIAKTDDGVIWIAGENHALFKSVDKGKTWQQIETPFMESFFGVHAITDNRVLTFGLRGRIAIFNADGYVDSTKETDETLSSSLQLADGRIILAGQRGRLLIGANNGGPFKSMKVAPVKDISSIVEAVDALIIAGEFGITRVLKTDLGI